MPIAIHEIPIDNGLSAELRALWEKVFGHSYAGYAALLAGDELHDSRNRIFVARENGVIAGTCHLTVSKGQPQIAGLGEVAVPDAFRGRGIASQLCGMARDRFFSEGGQALFLATSNPAAFRIYHRLGWRRLAGTNAVMLLTRDGIMPEAWLVDYFRFSGIIAITEGSAADRIPMIPLLVTPHDWHVLDANLGLCSTRYIAQTSCMALFRRYADLREREEGTWFSARDTGGRLLGLATLRRGADAAQLDGFTHAAHATCWETLMRAALNHGASQGIHTYTARVSLLDEDKIARFQQLGFRESAKSGVFDLPPGPPIPAIAMRMGI